MTFTCFTKATYDNEICTFTQVWIFSTLYNTANFCLTGICPDDSPSQETESTDLSDAMLDLDPGVFDQFQQMISTEGGMNELIKLISSSLAAMKEN